MTLKFGTDGIRGRAHDELTVSDVERLALAAATVLDGDVLVIGADTRESGPAFVEALCRGVARAGVTPWVMGVAPTPAVAHAAAEHGVAGAVVSASHNPYYDNGVKFFAPGGRKLTDEQQHQLETELSGLGALQGPADGSREDRSDLLDDYQAWVASTVAPGALGGLQVVVDCANGAASSVAGDTLAALGARISTIHDRPDGRNINEASGSTDMSLLREQVVATGADLGVAFDGDADRVLAVDAAGEIVDGDQIIAICALDRHRRGTLADDTVVVTVMTNLGFRLAMDDHGVRVHETPVGDRHVLEALEREGWSLGGEQSGHVIFHDLATTGDGLLTAIQLLDVVARAGRPLNELAAAAMTRLPQTLRNVRVEGSAAAIMDALADDIARVETHLGETGRLLVRPSGTEPLIRVMAEAPTQAAADAAVADLVAVVEALAG